MNIKKNDPTFTIEDLQARFPWEPVDDKVWESMPHTFVDEKNGGFGISCSDIQRMIEQECHYIARQLLLPYRDVYRLVKKENGAFYKLRFQLFWVRYGWFVNFRHDDHVMQELKSLLLFPNINAPIDKADNLFTACKGLNHAEMLRFITGVMKNMTAEELNKVIQELPSEILAGLLSCDAEGVEHLSAAFNKLSQDDKAAFMKGCQLVPRAALDKLRETAGIAEDDYLDPSLLAMMGRND